MDVYLWTEASPSALAKFYILCYLETARTEAFSEDALSYLRKPSQMHASPSFSLAPHAQSPGTFVTWICGWIDASILKAKQNNHQSLASRLSSPWYWSIRKRGCKKAHTTIVFIQRFQARGQHLYKRGVYIIKEFNPHGICLGHQHGYRFIVLEHQYGRHDVMSKKALCNMRKPVSFWRENVVAVVIV